MTDALFKIEDRGNGYRFATCPEHPGFSAMLMPGDIWMTDDHIRSLVMLVALDVTAVYRAALGEWNAARMEMCAATIGTPELTAAVVRLGRAEEALRALASAEEA